MQLDALVTTFRFIIQQSNKVRPDNQHSLLEMLQSGSLVPGHSHYHDQILAVGMAWNKASYQVCLSCNQHTDQLFYCDVLCPLTLRLHK